MRTELYQDRKVARHCGFGAPAGAGAGAGVAGDVTGDAGAGPEVVGAACDAAGAGTDGAGAAPSPGVGTAGFFCAAAAASSRIVFGCSLAVLFPRYASTRLLIMKIAAKIAVARDSAVLAPRAPNTVPDAPAPKPAPASAPFPRWSRTSPMIAKHEITCRIVKNKCSIGSQLILVQIFNESGAAPAAAMTSAAMISKGPPMSGGRGGSGQDRYELVRLE